MNSQLEAYLAQLESQLQGLNARDRHDIVMETRQHLEALIADGQGQGQSEDEATRQALQRFGDVSKLGKELRRVRRGSLRKAVLIASGWYTLLFVSYIVGFANGGSMPMWMGQLFFLWAIFGGPFVAGLATGLVARFRATLGAVIAFCIWAGFFVLLVGTMSRDEGEWLPLMGFFVAISLPLVCAGTWIGSALRPQRSAINL